MMRHAIFLFALAALVLTSGCEPGPVTVADGDVVAKDGVDPKANHLLLRASEYLRQAKTFQFQAEIRRDVIMYDELPVEFGGVSKVTFERPNRLHAAFVGDERSRESFYNGKTLTIYSTLHHFYSQIPIEGTIGDAIDHLHERFGFSVPLADLVYENPYAVLIENVEKGFFVGQHKIDGVLCDHLAFQQEGIDWQIWIEADETPLMRKIVITYKSEAGSPEYEAKLSHWKLNLGVRDSQFEFTPPAGSEKIEFLPLEDAYDFDEDEEVEEIDVTVQEVEAK